MDDTQKDMQVLEPGTIFVDDTGRQVRVAKNGALQDAITGKIVAGPTSGGSHAITSATSHEMLALRRQKALQAAIDGLCAGTKVKPGDVQGGLQVLFQAQALLAQDVNKGRASTEAMRLILQVLGLFAKNSEAGDGSATATLSLSREALQDLAQLLLRHGSNGDK